MYGVGFRSAADGEGDVCRDIADRKLLGAIIREASTSRQALNKPLCYKYAAKSRPEAGISVPKRARPQEGCYRAADGEGDV